MAGLFRRAHLFAVDLLFNLLVNKIAGARLVPRNMRWLLMRAAGMRTHPSMIAPGIFFGSNRIELGPGVQLSPQTFFDGAGRTVVEAGVGIGPRCLIITGAHDIGGPERRAGKLAPEPIVIEAGAWLGAGVTVLPGVRIGAGAVIAAGSVVVHDCEPNGVYAGVPARHLRTLADDAATGIVTALAALRPAGTSDVRPPSPRSSSASPAVDIPSRRRSGPSTGCGRSETRRRGAR